MSVAVAHQRKNWRPLNCRITSHGLQRYRNTILPAVQVTTDWVQMNTERSRFPGLSRRHLGMHQELTRILQ